MWGDYRTVNPPPKRRAIIRRVRFASPWLRSIHPQVRAGRRAFLIISGIVLPAAQPEPVADLPSLRQPLPEHFRRAGEVVQPRLARPRAAANDDSSVHANHFTFVTHRPEGFARECQCSQSRTFGTVSPLGALLERINCLPRPQHPHHILDDLDDADHDHDPQNERDHQVEHPGQHARGLRVHCAG